MNPRESKRTLIGNQFSRILMIFLLGICSPIQAEDAAPKRTLEQAKQWVIKGKREVCRLIENRGVSRIAFSSDTKILAMLERSHLRIWDWQERKELFDIRIPSMMFLHLEFSKDGRYVTCGTIKGGVLLWDLSKKAEKILLKTDRYLNGSLAFSPDSALLAAGGGKELLVWTLPGGGKPNVLTDSVIKVWSARPKCFVDDKHLITGDAIGKVRMWNLKSKQLKFEYDVKWDASSIPFSIDIPKEQTENISEDIVDYRVLPDGKRLVCLVSATATVMYAKTDDEARSLDRSSISQLAGYILVVDIHTGKEIWHSKRDDAWMGFNLDVTADGRYVLVGSGKMIVTRARAGESVNVSQSSVRVFDATSGKERYKYDVDKGIIPYVSVSPDGRYVATSSEKGVVIYRTPRAVWVKSACVGSAGSRS